MKSRPKIPPKIKAVLQKEINSECPICFNQEVEYFEIHHIDENPENNVLSNLILLCPNCHTKITKKDISEAQVRKLKNNLPNLTNLVEFVSVVVDSSKCNWVKDDENDLVFFQDFKINKPSFPFLRFSLINHFSKTIILKKIALKVKTLPKGISGIREPRVLELLANYLIEIKKENNVLDLLNPIHAPANESFMFQIQLSEKLNDIDEQYEINGRKVLLFSFYFSNNIVLNIPNIYLNCKSENEKIKIALVHGGSETISPCQFVIIN